MDIVTSKQVDSRRVHRSAPAFNGQPGQSQFSSLEQAPMWVASRLCTCGFCQRVGGCVSFSSANWVRFKHGQMHYAATTDGLNSLTISISKAFQILYKSLKAKFDLVHPRLYCNVAEQGAVRELLLRALQHEDELGRESHRRFESSVLQDSTGTIVAPTSQRHVFCTY